jgi:hypothetical protein
MKKSGIENNGSVARSAENAASIIWRRRRESGANWRSVAAGSAHRGEKTRKREI